jgi:alkanesulfonate monooxygenase
MTARFHWRLLQGGEGSGDTRGQAAALSRTGMPDLARQIEFCKLAEDCGIAGVLTDFGISKPDPLVLTAALGLATDKIEFIIAYRSGLICPVSFTQQINTLSAMIGGRISINVVAGHSPAEQRAYGDFLTHDERYSRTEEFLTICNGLWAGNEPVNFHGAYYTVENAVLNTPYLSPARQSPELFIAGNSRQAQETTIRQGTLWMRMADTPSNVAREVAPVIAAGREAGLRCAIICRETREEAITAAYALVAGLDRNAGDRARESGFHEASDSVCVKTSHELADVAWPTPFLWTGAIPTHGPATAAIVGSPVDVAAAIIEYERAGVSQFIFSGWPKTQQMRFFGDHVLPLVRRAELGLISHRSTATG